jgi:hypothetical protein
MVAAIDVIVIVIAVSLSLGYLGMFAVQITIVFSFVTILP